MSFFPVVLSSPSGGGKTTIAKTILERRTDVGYSISCTTRPRRAGEEDGRDYHFWSVDRFEAARGAAEFAESATVHGHLYGTLRSEIDRVIRSGRHVILDIDVQGAAQLRAALPECVLIFVLPPSVEALIDRLGARGSEDPATLARRLRSATAELLMATEYEYVVVNEILERAVADVQAIISAESLRTTRIGNFPARLGRLVAEVKTRPEFR